MAYFYAIVNCVLLLIFALVGNCQTLRRQFNIDNFYYQTGLSCERNFYSLGTNVCPLECSYCGVINKSYNPRFERDKGPLVCIFYDLQHFIGQKITRTDQKCVKKKCMVHPCQSEAVCVPVYNSFICECANNNFGKFCEGKLSADWQGKIPNGIQMWVPTSVVASKYFPFWVSLNEIGDADNLRIEVSDERHYMVVFKAKHENKFCNADPKRCSCSKGCKYFYSGSLIGVYEYIQSVYARRPVLARKTVQGYVTVGWTENITIKVFNDKFSASQPVFEDVVMTLTRAYVRDIHKDFTSNQKYHNCATFIKIDHTYCGQNISEAPLLDGSKDLSFQLASIKSYTSNLKQGIENAEILRDDDEVCSKSPLRFTWNFYSMDEVRLLHEKNYEEMSVFKSCNSLSLSEPTCDVPSNRIQQGEYLVKARVEIQDMSGDTTSFGPIYDHDYCYIKVKLTSTFKIHIEGPRQITTDPGVGVEFKTTGVENIPSSVHHEWTCVYEKTKKCPGKSTIDDFYKVPGEQLTTPGSYVYTVTVTNGDLHTTDSIEVIVNPGPPVDPTKNETQREQLFIGCSNNCGKRQIPGENIDLFLYYSNDKKRDVTEPVSWTYTVDNGKEQPITNIIDPQRNPREISIKSDSLEEGKTYNICLVVKNKCDQSFTFTYNPDKPPANGKCAIMPVEGNRGYTLFDIECTGWIDEEGILVYEFFDNAPEDKLHYVGRMMGTTATGRLFQFRLTRGTVVIYIINMNGLASNFTINVKLTTMPHNETHLQNLMKTAQEHLLQQQYTRLLRLTSVIAEILDEDSLRDEYLEKLILTIQKVPIKGFADMLLCLSSIKIVLVDVTDKGKYKLNDVKEVMVARILFALSEIFMKVVRSPLHTPKLNPSNVHQISKHFLDSFDTAILARDETIILSPEEDVDYPVIRNLFYSSGTISSALKIVMYCVGRYQNPAAKWVDIPSTENLSNVWAMVDVANALSKNVSATQDLNVKLSTKFASYYQDGYDMLLQYAVMKENMFWWAQGHISTDLVQVKLAYKLLNQDFHYLRFLKQPIQIFLNVKPFEKGVVHSSVVQMDTTLDKDFLDGKLQVHQIMPPPLSKLYIRFNFTDTKTKLRVLILVNKRPDWDLMMKKAQIISEENNEYDTPYDTIDRFNVYYMGILPGKEVSEGSSINYTFTIYYMLCRTWSTQWVSHFCLVGKETTESVLECRCTHLSILAGAIFVPPNDIDPFADSKLFLTVVDNPWGVLFVLLLLLFYFLTMLLAARRDKKDKLYREVIVLDDNFPGETFGYLIAVHTGSRLAAGTSATVGIRIYGELYASRPHILRSPKRRVLQRGNDDWFLIYYPISLGALNSVQLWHDNKGCSPDWFCSKIVVYDLNKKSQFIFMVEQWLAFGVNEFPEAFVRPATVDEVLSIKRILLENSLYGLRENHTWLSVFVRHPRSTVTRKERLTVLMVCVMTALLTNIMFYRVSDNYADGVDDPEYSVEMTAIIISIEGFIVSAIFTIIVLFLFRKSSTLKVEMQKSVLYTPSRKSPSTDTSQFWLSSTPSYINLKEMKAYTEKEPKERKDMTMCESIIKVIKKLAVSKKLQPVQLASHPADFITNKKWLVVAWSVSLIIILVSAYLVMLYSLRFGNVKSLKWLSSVGMTFGQDILLFGPFKILLFSVVLALAFQRVVNESSFQLNVIDAIKLDFVGNKEYLDKLVKRRNLPIYYPISEDKKKILREKQWRIIMWRTLLDFVTVVLFILVLCVVMNNMWSGAHYEPNRHVLKLVTLPKDPEAIPISHIFNRSDFIQYLDKTFAPSLYCFRWFNSLQMPLLTAPENSSGRKDWTADFTSRLMGIPRLRQLRVKPEKCHVNKLLAKYELDCILPWSDSNSDDNVYGVDWQKARYEDLLREQDYWRYTEPWNSSVFPLSGKTGTVYPSGGYVVDLGASRAISVHILSYMREYNWQDVYTRATFVELTVYNINNHLFSQVTVVAEHLPYGLFLVASNVDSVHIREEISIWNMSYIIFVVILFVRILYKINRNGFINYIKTFLNIYEAFVIVLGILSSIMYLVHLYQSSLYVELFQRQGLDNFFNFKEVVSYFLLTKLMLWILFCFTVFRLFITWTFGRTFFTYYYTFVLSRPWVVIILFLYLIYFFISWRALGYVISAMVLPNYRTIILHSKSYKSFNHEGTPFRERILAFVLSLFSLLLNLFCFLMFTYYYKIARSYLLKSKHYFNFFTFIFEEFKTCFGKNKQSK